MVLNISILVLLSVLVLSNCHLVIDLENSRTFDKDLYERVLDSEECTRQINFLKENDTMLFARFLDSGMRVPRGLNLLSATDLGDYHQCLRIIETREDEGGKEMNIEGKYSFLQIPLNQTFQAVFDDEEEEILLKKYDFSNMKIVKFDNTIISEVQSFAVARTNNGSLDSKDVYQRASINVALCIPKVCTSLEYSHQILFNLSQIGFRFDEEFVRLPNDKPWVAVDYVAIVIFSVIAFLTLVGTAYDVTHIVILKKDPKRAIVYLRMFSIYTNTKRLMTFNPNPNAIECMDGIRTISMMWVLVGHAFSMHNFNINLLDGINWVTSADGVWVSTGLFSVDSFFLMAGILLVYTSVGKMSGTTFLKRVHVFYLNRLLRMFPLLAALVLLEASVFHRIADGPYWVNVARNAERCRSFWWTTLLHVQNYVNPEAICVAHSWYIAIDIQLHIVSPLILFWVLGKNRTASWSALISGLVAVQVGATIWNFMKDMPPTNMTIPRLDEQDYYMTNFYVNTLTRASPFFVGMIYGYILSIYKGKQIRLNMIFVLIAWMIGLAMIAFCFYASYEVMKLDWDNQVLDNLFNSFMRTLWAIGLGWVIFACGKGYGGPIDWFLSLSIWKLPARLSYAMYLYHYPIMFLGAGMEVMPKYFSQGGRIFDFKAYFVISLWVSYLVTVIIDAPCSTVIKMLIEGGQKKRRPPPEKGADLSKSHKVYLPNCLEKDGSLLENNVILTTLKKDDNILDNKNNFSLQRNGPIPEHEHIQKNGILENNDLAMGRNGLVKDDLGLGQNNLDVERNLPLQKESDELFVKSEDLDGVEVDGEFDKKEVSKF
ncbi:uncharacterized protein LOC112050180 [Bicyclus anynana]|uniref:Uncharacterized protein LOC112050180 n=1 Tax=Bicyclus anynana TaxID=110368 RepID=A0A6J1NLX8_BICAN|nr:uncharacterized protein LOC112050180 [Bicyclus anynana]